LKEGDGLPASEKVKMLKVKGSGFKNPEKTVRVF
jgi:hypothetical protein